MCLKPIFRRTLSQKTKWSYSRSPGALTAQVSKDFSATTSRMSSSMLLSRFNQRFGFPWYAHRPSTPRLDKREDGNPIQQYLHEKTGQRTVPNVFVSEYAIRWVPNRRSHRVFWRRSTTHRRSGSFYSEFVMHRLIILYLSGSDDTTTSWKSGRLSQLLAEWDSFWTSTTRNDNWSWLEQTSVPSVRVSNG